MKELCKNGSKRHWQVYEHKKSNKEESGCKSHKAKKTTENLLEKTNNVLMKMMKKEGKNVEGGRFRRKREGFKSFSKIDRRKEWKDHMEKIMNDENEEDQMTEDDVVERPLKRVTRKEME